MSQPSEQKGDPTPADIAAHPGTAVTLRLMLLQDLYRIHKGQAARANTDSHAMALRLSIDQDVVELVAVELHKMNLVRFDACDDGLLNVHLTVEGIEQVEHPGKLPGKHFGLKSSIHPVPGSSARHLLGSRTSSRN